VQVVCEARNLSQTNELRPAASCLNRPQKMRRAPASHAETDASNWEIARIAAECFEVGQIFGDAL
jgi:hypothetical protein